MAQTTKKRGFVMTGGGAKGSYEAGVIHAFHITGMDFDVITGSSIGAMNSIVYAEYQYRKKTLLTDAERANPMTVVDCMDPYVKAFHHTWLRMPDFEIVDDSETGPIGRLKNDLAGFKVNIPQIVRLAWWYTDPDRGKAPGPELWPAAVGLALQGAGLLGGGELLRVLKDHSRYGLAKTALRAFLKPRGLERSLVPDEPEGQESPLARAFSNPITPLHGGHLEGDVGAEYDPAAQPVAIVDPKRTFRDYWEHDIDLRLTRSNYRTGRFEMSSYVTPESFVRYMQKQAWRLEVPDPARIPLGSFRVQMPGNPNVIHAGLASGRYPGVFAPYPLGKIYTDTTDDLNDLLFRLVDKWLDDKRALETLEAGYREAKDHGARLMPWNFLLKRWNGDSRRMQGFFPERTDTYVDGGAIDNTPSNPAVDAIREWIDRTAGQTRRGAELELWVVYLNEEPRVDTAVTEDVALYDVVQRTLKIVDVAKKSADVNTVDVINGFGEQSEKLGLAVRALLASYDAAVAKLSPEDRAAADRTLAGALEAAGVFDEDGRTVRVDQDDPDGQLGRWANDLIDRKLPLPVQKVIIYPDRMPLGTLNFTGRLGYKKQNAIDMLTSGCYNTLFALRNRLERQPEEELDDKDRASRDLARTWMRSEVEWPDDETAQIKMKDAWRCTRKACAFYARHCPRGAQLAV